MTTLVSEIQVAAPIEQLYRAFTNATALREWLCDVATVVPHPQGRMYLWWNGDFYSSGHYLNLTENKQVSFRWFSSIDSAPTEVTVHFETKGKNTQVRLEHEVPNDPNWAKTGEIFKQNWDDSLENLKSVYETGIDLRIANRPMLGIYPGDFTAEQAKRLGVPVNQGLRLDDTIEGMGAYQAGLRKDDVLINVNNHEITNEFTTMIAAIAGTKGGDTVPVVFYRGAEKQTVNMTLTKRPMTNVPFNIEELVNQARSKMNAAFNALEEAFKEASEAQAAARPAPNEWSALDVVSHILHTERGLQFFFDECIGGHERAADDFGGNIDAHIRAITASHSGIQDMLNEVHRAQVVTLNFVSNLPPEAVQRKGSFYRLGDALLQNDLHIYGHIEQIKAALAAAQ